MLTSTYVLEREVLVCTINGTKDFITGSAFCFSLRYSIIAHALLVSARGVRWLPLCFRFGALVQLGSRSETALCRGFTTFAETWCGIAKSLQSYGTVGNAES